MRANSMVLSMAMAQTQTEHTRSPTMTDSTIQWACQNRWNSDRFDDVNGATDWAMSPEFMGRPFHRSGRPTAKTRHHDRHSAIQPGPKGIRQPLRAHRPTAEISLDPAPDPPPARPKSPRNLSKLGRNTGHPCLTKPDCA